METVSDIQVLQGQEPSRIAAISRRHSRTLQVGIGQVIGNVRRDYSASTTTQPANPKTQTYSQAP